MRRGESTFSKSITPSKSRILQWITPHTWVYRHHKFCLKDYENKKANGFGDLGIEFERCYGRSGGFYGQNEKIIYMKFSYNKSNIENLPKNLFI